MNKSLHPNIKLFLLKLFTPMITFLNCFYDNVSFHFYLFIFFSFQPKEGSRIWKMHLVKGQDGLGVQITGGRGSKRSPHGIVVAHVEKGGAVQR